jgi:hypothetical protein
MVMLETEVRVIVPPLWFTDHHHSQTRDQLTEVRILFLPRFEKILRVYVSRTPRLTHAYFLQLVTDPAIKSLAEEFLREFGDVDYEVFSADIVLNAKKPEA